MKVLVTGASGFIGNRISAYFREKGFSVTGWDVITTKPEIKKINLLDYYALKTGLESVTPDIIIHCAGSADVNKSVQDPEMDFTGNVVITHNLLFALYQAGLTNTTLVYLSSAGIYGNPQSLPITEEMLPNPLSPYAVHKVMCEDLCKFFAKSHGMNIKIARIFSAYGAGLKKQIFWDMFRKYKKTGRLDMYGTGYESRDYIHVDDVAQAIFLLATERTDEIICNVANGEEITIREATEIMAENLGVNMGNISFNGIVREGDPLNWCADIKKIQRLGYQKTVGIEDGLRDYCRWAEEQEDGI